MTSPSESQDVASTLCPALTLKQRLLAFSICVFLGVCFDVLSMGKLRGVMHGHAEKYARMYTFGNIVALSGTLFLAGPTRQLRRMCQQKRWIASLVFLVAIVLTLTIAYAGKHMKGRTFVIVLLVVAQWCSLVWYGLTYIPYGPQMAWAVLRSFCCDTR